MFQLSESMQVLEDNITAATSLIPVYAAISAIFEELYSQRKMVTCGFSNLLLQRISSSYSQVIYSASNGRIKLSIYGQSDVGVLQLVIKHRSGTRLTEQIMNRFRKQHQNLVASLNEMLDYRNQIREDILEYNRLELELSKVSGRIQRCARISSVGNSILSRKKEWLSIL